ncbi:MAG: T9SS type A sorting domain-containing protein [Planctomycetota bacterium]
MLRKTFAVVLSLCLVSTLAGAEEKVSFPDGLKGFCGVLAGTVVSVQENGFIIKVQSIPNVWKNNKATDSESAVGKELLVNAKFEKGRPVEAHLKFINSLEPGEEIKIEAVNDEGTRLHILELSKEQRQRPGKAESADGEIEYNESGFYPIKSMQYAGKDNQGAIGIHSVDDQKFKVELFSENGQAIKSADSGGGQDPKIEGLESGFYLLRITAQGYKTLEKKVKVQARYTLFCILKFKSKKPANKPVSELPKEQPEPAVKANPSDGEIVIGETRYNIWNSDVTYAKGRKDKIGGIYVSSEDAQKFKAELVGENGQVIKSADSKEEQERQRCKIEELEAGSYLLRITARGYKTLEKKVKIQVGFDFSVPLEFKAKNPAKPDEKSFPKGLKGFCGVLAGTVVSVQEDGFILKVQKSLPVDYMDLSEGNFSKEPKSAVGKELLISAKCDKVQPIETQIRFIKSLKPGEEIKIEVVNKEGERLDILELSKEQLKRAGK